MLKWTVTRPPSTTDLSQTDLQQNCSSKRMYRKAKRKNKLQQNKENIYTSTPHRVPKKECLLSSPLPLQNLSNIDISLGENFKRRNNYTEDNQKNKKFIYCSTLPTFDIEYSPCNFEEKSILPEAFRQEESFLYKTPLPVNQHPDITEESIHSSKVGDVTLERIIDDILKSAKKYPKKSNNKFTASPSYQRCSDPANDLRFHNGKLIMSPKDFIKAVEKTVILDKENNENEREIKTPSCQTPILPGYLRRQRALKLKCKIK